MSPRLRWKKFINDDPLMILCDFHIHLGKSRDGASLQTDELLRAMRASKVRRAVVFPIDEPDVGLTYEKQNKWILGCAGRHPELIPFCRLNPRHRSAALKELDRCRNLGCRGLKLHPRAEKISPNSIDDILAKVAMFGWPVIMHISHEKNCRPLSWEKTFKKFRAIRFIFAHSGKDSFQEAAEVALRRPNIFMDTSTLSYNRTKTLLAKLGARRILFASDQPYSHIALEKKKFELACGTRERKAIFADNARRYFPEFCRA